MTVGPATEGVLATGSVLNGTYVIVGRLFEGGMGDIYEASHVRLTGRYAVKVLRHSLTAQHASAFDRFRREAEVTSSLRHPHIVQVVDFNQTAGGAAYFVMELLEGQNLRQVLEAGGAMSVADVTTIIEQVASALQAVHERGIVHRDLKPDNIHMVPIPGRKEPFVKVLDFGISKVLAASTLTQEAMLVGTPHYMAPEQVHGVSDDLDGRTDQFALGAIAHELLTGRRLFDSENVTAILYQVLHDEPSSLEAIAGPEVDVAVRRALAKNRDDRFPKVTDFADAVRDAVFGPPRSRVTVGASGGRAAVDSSGVPVARTPVNSQSASRQIATGDVAPAATKTKGGRRWLLVALGAGVAAAAAAGLLSAKTPRPTWSQADGEASTVGGALEATIRRVLDETNGRIADTAARAAKVPHIANAITGRVDEATFQDLLANELWWSDYRAFGCAVLVGDQLKVAWQLPVGASALALANAIRPGTTDTAARAGLQVDAAGAVLGAVASVDGVPGGRVLIVRPLDRALVTDLATRANTVLLLSDGQKLLGASVPENTMPEIGLLIGQEQAHQLVDRKHGRLTVAVPWSKALWLWGVSGWAP